ncbi:hypothetical protein WQ79_20245 [Escherichia coli]|nr:hypothetical protein [Escherichia coli]EEZ7468155.1 hypothetical protein [Escherichia coli]EFI3499763.1 hypothetical protein [Escherichia coli]EFM8925176.1 hypothetical protein [Escherichia coli]EGZ7911394.1 hypothetical protein [Escherichia coli]
MLPSETMIWQPEFTDKTLSRKTGAVQLVEFCNVCWSITCIVAGLSQRLLAERFVVTTSVSSLLIFVSEEVAVAVETIPEMHNDRVERI